MVKRNPGRRSKVLEAYRGEAEQGGGLHAEDEIAEGDGKETGGEGGCRFVGGEVTLRADRHGDALQIGAGIEDAAEILRVIGEGGDDLQFGGRTVR